MIGMTIDTGRFLGADLIDTFGDVPAGDGPGLDARAGHGAGAAASEPTVPVAIADLLPDASGEVVLSAADGMAIALSTRETPVDAGVADHHVTACGLDVSGFGYYSFADGLTVYFPHHSQVTLSLEERL